MYFQGNADDQALKTAMQRDSKLTGWFKVNIADPLARHLLYVQMPYEYIWRDKSWHRRKNEGYAERVIPRLHTTNPRDRELFSLRLLLLHVPGATSFEYLRTVNGELHPSISSAAKALRLLENDRECDDCLAEAVFFQMPRQLRQLFAFICISADAKVDVNQLWIKYKHYLCEDFLKRKIPVDASETLALAYMQDILRSNGLSLEKLGLPSVQYVPSEDSSFSDDDYLKFCSDLEVTLNDDQKKFVEPFRNAFISNKPGDRLFFIDGAAGTGKTHLYNYLFHLLKSKNIGVIACAFTGIAATLLPDGRTLHSAFKLPFIIKSESMSSITTTTHSEQYRLIRNLKVIIIDEASMISNVLFDCLDRSLQEICNDKRVFGGKFVIFGGDFRQILPVTPRGSRANIVISCIKSNPMWPRFRPLTLSKNMRADPQAKEFSTYLLKIGEGQLPRVSDANRWIVALREDIIVPYDDKEDNELRLIQLIFSNKLTVKNVEAYSKHVILCPTNLKVMDINNRIISDILEGDMHSYFSVDQPDTEESLDLPIESIHQLLPSGYTPHKLKLRTIVIVLQNLSTNEGIVNRTRAIVTQLLRNVIQLRILTGHVHDKYILLPRFTFIHESSEDGISLRFTRRKFPIRPAFAMTINKCQGQTFKQVGIYLDQPIFTHGQLYVAFSRMPNFSSLRSYTTN